MQKKSSGGEAYWRRYAAENHLGKPLRVDRKQHGYAIIFKQKRIDTPFVGNPSQLRRLVADIQKWIDE